MSGLGFLAFVPAAGEEPAEAGAGDGGGGESDGESPEDGAAEVGVVLDYGEHGGGMRGQGSVDDGESGEEGHSGEDGRLSGAAGGLSDDGHEEDEADLEEDGHADHDAEQEQRPGQAEVAAAFNQDAAQRGGAAGTGEEAAEDGTESKDDGDVGHEVADAGGEGERDLLERHSGSYAEGQCSHGEGQRGMQADAGDEDEQQQDGCGGAGDEVPTGWGRSGG